MKTIHHDRFHDLISDELIPNRGFKNNIHPNRCKLFFQKTGFFDLRIFFSLILESFHHELPKDHQQDAIFHLLTILLQYEGQA